MITCYYAIKEFVYPDLPPLDIPGQEKEHTGQIRIISIGKNNFYGSLKRNLALAFA